MITKVRPFLGLVVSCLYVFAFAFTNAGCGSNQPSSTVYMATWCSASKSFKALLNDPLVHDQVVKQKVVFVFADDEWPSVKGELKQAAKAGQIQDAQIPDLLDAMKFKVKGANVADPTFFNDLPGTHRSEKLPPEVDQFPTIEADGQWIKDGKEGHWLVDTLGLSVDDANQLIDKYMNTKSDLSSKPS